MKKTLFKSKICIRYKVKSVRKKSDKKWGAVQIQQDILNEVETFADSQFASRLGFNSKSQIINVSVKKFIDDIKKFMPIYEVIDITSTSVLIMDYELVKPVNLTIKSGKVICDIHNHNECSHLKFARLVPRFMASLRSHNIK